MSNDLNEDDWESAEKRLKDLSIKNKSSAPPKLLLRPTLSLSQTTSGSNTQPLSGARTSSPANTSAELDPALLNSISDPCERMAVFQIEHNILNFMKSNETTMEIPPGNNSFRRLLTYRIGQRFGLSHATSDQLPEGGGDRSVGIQFFKTAASGIPSVLLIDMKIAASHDKSSGEQSAGSESPFNSSQHSTATNNSSSGAGPRKMLVMQRKPSKSVSAATGRSTASTVKQQQSAEDKEKAYLQARARIFGETTPSTPGGSSPVNTPGGCEPVEGSTMSGATTPKSDVAVHSVNGSITTLSSSSSSNCSSGNISKNSSSNSLSTGGIAVQPQQKKPAGSKKPTKNASSKPKTPSPLSTCMISPSPNKPNSSAGTSASAGRPQQQGQTGGRVVVNAGAWKGNKSQVRNVELEKADPDFVRRAPSRSQSGAGSSPHAGGQQQQSSCPPPQPQPAPTCTPGQQSPGPTPGANPSDAMQLQQQQQQMELHMQQYVHMQHQYQQQQQHMHMHMYQQQQQGVPYYPYPPAPQHQQMPPYPGNPYYPYGAPYPQQQQGYPGQQRGNSNSSAPSDGFNSNDFPPLR